MESIWDDSSMHGEAFGDRYILREICMHEVILGPALGWRIHYRLHGKYPKRERFDYTDFFSINIHPYRRETHYIERIICTLTSKGSSSLHILTPPEHLYKSYPVVTSHNVPYQLASSLAYPPSPFPKTKLPPRRRSVLALYMCSAYGPPA